MDAAEILQGWQSRGVQARLDGNVVFLRAPRGLLGPSDYETLRQHRQELAAALLLQSRKQCCLCGALMEPGRVYRCQSCVPRVLSLVSEPCLVDGHLRTPVGYRVSTSLYELAVSLGVPEHLAAERYCKPKERQK